MTQQKKYTLLRNLALLSICGFLCFSLFPFPPILWRVLFLGTAIIAIWYNVNCISLLEKWVLGFWGLNLIYFFASYLWLDNPSLTQIGNISVTLLAIPLFGILGRKGILTERFYTIAVVLLLLSSVVYFQTMKVIMLSNFINRDDITNNASVVFLYILPFILLLKNRFVSYGVILICAYYLMEGAKRGNIICAIPVVFLFFVLTFCNKRIRLFEKVLFIIFSLFAVSWGTKQFVENEYLQQRIEQTVDGNSSGRDIIYTNAWKTFSDSENVRNVLFGYGFDGTRHHQNIRSYAHNDWLEILVDYGAIGIISYITIFLLLYKLSLQTKELQKRYVLFAIISVWLLKSAFSMGFTSETMFILFMLLGYVNQREGTNVKAILS